MIDLTPEQIAAAKGGDLTATTAVIRATEERVLQLARRHATTGGYTDNDLAEDLAQIGRIAVWECLERFEAPYDVAMFFVFMDSTVSGTLSNARRSTQRQGVTQQAAKDFETALRLSGGEPYEAEKFAATDGMGARKMSPEMAYAARMSWQGLDYLDAPYQPGNGSGERAGGNDRDVSLGEHLSSTYGVPDDLIEPEDIDAARRAATKERVHGTLAKMGQGQRDILKGTFGISPAPFFGTDNEDELADYARCARSQVRANRKKAKDRFRDLYPMGETSGDFGPVTA